MHVLKHFATGFAALTLCAASMAATIEINGVKIEDSATVGGTKIPLNGAGTRYKGPFKVYVADLYVSKKINNLEELIAAPGPKRLTMTMVREVEANQFGKLLTRGVEDNVPKGEMSKLVPGLMRMGDLFNANKTLAPGDQILLEWIPGTGMVVTVKGKVQGEPFKEPEFFKGLMSIWLGPVPADWKLKDQLLGVK